MPRLADGRFARWGIGFVSSVLCMIRMAVNLASMGALRIQVTMLDKSDVRLIAACTNQLLKTQGGGGGNIRI